jgi:hypothetical protein
MRRAFGGGRSWWLSMGLLGVVGVLVTLLSLMGWGGEVYLHGVPYF